MSLICPLCNGLDAVKEQCPYCSNLLEDTGTVTEYAGPYRPYLEQSVSDRCTHLLACPACGADQRLDVTLIPV